MGKDKSLCSSDDYIRKARQQVVMGKRIVRRFGKSLTVIWID